MKLGSSHFLNGALCALLAGAVAAACGSDAGKRSVRAEDGGAGGGGAGAVTHSGGGTAQPQLGGDGGVPEPAAAGGNGGVPSPVTAGEGGVPVVASGGVPGDAGAAGAPETLPAVNCDTIVLADPQLEAAVRYALDTSGVITPEAAASITDLGSSNYTNIATLAGIECFTGVTDLYLGIGGQPSHIQDLTPLRYLKKLTTLDLSYNSLTTLETLAKLPNLQELNLTGAVKHAPLAPLASAPALSTLQLDNCQLDDLAPLAGIATLNHLELNFSTLSAPASLSALSNVKELLVANVLSDAAPLATLTQLQLLDVSNHPLTSFNTLSALVNLTSLNVSYTGITSISAVSSMTKLTELKAIFDDVADLSPLQGLTQLQTVYLNANPVTDITPLVNNAGIGAGDDINLGGTTLDCPTQTANVATLVGRGVNYAGPCN